MIATGLALAISAGAAVVGTAATIHQGAMAKKSAKGQNEAQSKLLAEQKEVETGKRKTMIKNMRANVGNGGYSLNKTGATGFGSSASTPSDETLG